MTPNPELDVILISLPERIHTLLKGYLNRPGTHHAMDVLRVELTYLFDPLRSYHEIENPHALSWLFLEWIKDERRVELRLIDSYNCPAWLWHVLEGVQRLGPIK